MVGRIVVNLLTLAAPRFCDVALRDSELALAAVPLARLATGVARRGEAA